MRGEVVRIQPVSGEAGPEPGRSPFRKRRPTTGGEFLGLTTRRRSGPGRILTWCVLRLPDADAQKPAAGVHLPAPVDHLALSPALPGFDAVVDIEPGSEFFEPID